MLGIASQRTLSNSRQPVGWSPSKSGSRIPFAERPVARTFLALASCGPPVCTAGSRLAGSRYLLTLEPSTEKSCGALGLLWPAGLLQVRARQAMGGVSAWERCSTGRLGTAENSEKSDHAGEQDLAGSEEEPRGTQRSAAQRGGSCRLRNGACMLQVQGCMFPAKERKRGVYEGTSVHARYIQLPLVWPRPKNEQGRREWAKGRDMQRPATQGG